MKLTDRTPDLQLKHNSGHSPWDGAGETGGEDPKPKAMPEVGLCSELPPLPIEPDAPLPPPPDEFLVHGNTVATNQDGCMKRYEMDVEIRDDATHGPNSIFVVPHGHTAGPWVLATDAFDAIEQAKRDERERIIVMLEAQGYVEIRLEIEDPCENPRI